MSRAELWMGGLVLLALSGCSTVASPTTDAHHTVPAPVAPKAQAAAHAQPGPPTPPASKKAETPPARPARAPRETAPSPPPFQPVGMDEGRIKAVLGPPNASQDEAPGRLLSFRRRECVLNLTLYPDVETRVFRTLSYEVTSDDHDTRSTALCHARFGIAYDGDANIATGKPQDGRRSAAAGPSG